MTEADFAEMRKLMLVEIAANTIYTSAQIGKAALSARVLDVMGRVPRHLFVPFEIQQYAYVNSPLPIGLGKTISQPFIVALMTDLLDIAATDVVLEIGTGLGYQAAILAELSRHVYSVEVHEELAEQAEHRLARHGYANVDIKIGNGYLGWPEHAPFDKVMVTAAPELIPPSLLYQLKSGGRMVLPAGLADAQKLMLVEKDVGGRVSTKEILPVRFSSLEGVEPFG
jgi:protein-L-isoaspartate(D-aspartate) O-methyltransferase